MLVVVHGRRRTVPGLVLKVSPILLIALYYKKGLSESHCLVIALYYARFLMDLFYRIRFELTGRIPVLCRGSSAVLFQSLLEYAPLRIDLTTRPCCTLLTEWNNVSFTLQRKSVHCGSSYPLGFYLALADVIGGSC